VGRIMTLDVRVTRKWLCSGLLVAAASLLLGGCGFHLRGEASLPFKTLYVQAAPTSQFAVQLRRVVGSSSTTRIVDNPQQAEATLDIALEQREKEILSLSAGGRVREYQLRYRLSYRVFDKDRKEIAPVSIILLRRDFAFNDQEALSKEAEEALLFRDMQNDAVQQLVRRLQVIRLAEKS
jgi:LPS-assembly lipoprotein